MIYLQAVVVLCIGVFIGWYVFDHEVANSPSPDANPVEEVAEITEVTEQVDKAEDTNIPPDVFVPSGSLTTLDLSGQGLTQVPGNTFSKTNIQNLDISNNNLTGALQAEVRHLQQLQVLDMSDNNFTGVPAEVGQLSRLRVLDLSNNQLTGIPHELGNLSNLKVLDLQGNDISIFDLDIIRERLGSDVEIKL